MHTTVSDARARRPLRPADFRDWTEYYWSYQYELAHGHLVPTLRRWGVWREGLRVLDVGCGDGGASAGMADAGARVLGFDLDPRRIEGATRTARERGIDVAFGVGDITDASTLVGREGPYDLVVFRDVLEHIPDVDAALRHSRERLAEGGAILVVYPPYWSPFGGHQQILHPPRRLGVRWAKLPFVHWLPASWWRALARGAQGDDPQWEEIETIRRAKLTVGGLARRARQHGLVVARAERYLLRPTFRLRYGTPVWGAGPLGTLPGLREIFVSGSWELLRVTSDDPSGDRAVPDRDDA